MDYTYIPQQLIYRNRKSLEEFTKNNELNECIVDNLSDIYYLQSYNFKERVTACFNAAYYICTLIIADKHPEWSLPRYYDIALGNQKDNIVGQAITLSIVKVYLVHFDMEWHNKHKKLIRKLDTYLNSHSVEHGDLFIDYYSYNDAFNEINSFEVATASFSIADFALRAIDQEAINELRVAHFSWTNFTDYYNYNIMHDIVFSVGKNEDEMILLVKSLRQDADCFYTKDNIYYETVCSNLSKIEHEVHQKYHDSENEVLSKAENEINKQLKEKDEEIQRLKGELEVYQQEPISDNPHDKVRLEVLCKLLEESDVKFNVHGVKAEAARFAQYITGLPASTCRNYMTNRDLNTTKHSEEVLRTNTSIKKLGIKWQL